MTDTWIHIPTPGDHYSPRTGSAVITVIHQMCRHHTGESKVIVQRGTMDGYDVGERIEIDYPRTGTPAAWRKTLDRAVGLISPARPFSGHAYYVAARAIGPDFSGVVLVHNEPAGIEVIARHCPHARVVLWVQNELFRTYTAAQTRRVIQMSHRVICCSDFIRRGIVAIAGESEKLVTVLNGVDTEMFRPDTTRRANDVPLILFVGRMIPEKGPDLLLEAAKHLKNRRTRFKLRMVGSAGFSASEAMSGFEQVLRQLVNGLEDVVEFFAFTDRSRIIHHYQEADLFCAPSRWDEPFGLTALEAMSSGLAVLSSGRGGLVEAGGDAIRVITELDPRKWSDAIGHLVTNESERRALGEAGRRHAEALSWASRYNQLLPCLSASRSQD